MTQITINESCLGPKCGQCVKTCMADVFSSDETIVKVMYPEACLECGHCIAICPQNAIAHESFPKELESTSSTLDATLLHQDLASFRSIRRFKKMEIPNNILMTLVEAASFAPTAHNQRDMVLDVYQGDKLFQMTELAIDEIKSTIRLLERPFVGGLSRILGRRAIYEEAKKFLPELKKTVDDWNKGRDRIFFNAPTVILLSLPSRTFADADAYLAAANIRLQARALSLGSTLVGYFVRIASRSSDIRNFLGLEQGYSVKAVLALGYPKQDFKRIPPRPLPVVNWHPLGAEH